MNRYKQIVNILFGVIIVLVTIGFTEKDQPFGRIVAWGDSMMAGNLVEKSLVEIISDSLNDLSYVNYAIGGSTSQKAALLQGAVPFYLSFEVDEIPAVGIINAYKYNIEPYNYQSPINYRIGNLEGVKGVLRRCSSGIAPYPTTHFEFERRGKGDPVKIQDSARFYFDHSKMMENDLVLIWTGRNDKLDKKGRIAALKNIEAMVKTVNGQDSKRSYFVISVCNGLGDNEGKDSKPYKNITQFNKSLKKSFGSNYVDLRGYLVSQALKDLNIQATLTDIQDMNADAIPRSLLLDQVHLNQLGTVAAANYLSKVIKERTDI